MKETTINRIIITTTIFMLAIAAYMIFLMGYTLTMTIMSNAPQENANRVTRVVEAVCDYSANVQDREAEDLCGIAQDRSNTEYTCTNNECVVKEK